MRAPFDPSSREREAREEMAATRVGRGTARALVGLPLALFACALMLEAVALARGESRLPAPLPPPPPTLAADRLFGAGNARLLAAAREIEHRLDEGSAIARAIRPWGQLALTAWLGFGNEEAYVGRGGLLVFRDDFDHSTRRAVAAGAGSERAARETAAFARALEERGIALLVVLAPAKPAVHPDRFGRASAAAPVEGPRDEPFARALAAAGVPLLEPSRLLRRSARARGEDLAYLERDTHWRPAAMDAVAREIALRLRALADLPVGERGRFHERSVTVEGIGDSLALLGLPTPLSRFGAERVEVARVEQADGSPWRPERAAPVLLLGDSFAAIYSQPELGFGAGGGLAERLSFHLGLPVDRILRNAGGATATREALAQELARDPTRLAGVRAIVWQLAARELTTGDWQATPLPAAE